MYTPVPDGMGTGEPVPAGAVGYGGEGATEGLPAVTVEVTVTMTQDSFGVGVGIAYESVMTMSVADGVGTRGLVRQRRKQSIK